MYDADTLSQWLFSAGAGPFLARELADGVVHFLQADGDEHTTDDVADAAVRVVRELGHPALARALEATRPAAADTTAGVYPTNILAAQDAGLLNLGELDQPRRMAGGLIEPLAESRWDRLRAFEQAGERFSRFLVLANLDGPGNAAEVLTALRFGLRISGRPAVINIGAPASPPGPPSPSLFPEFDRSAERHRSAEIGLAVVDAWTDDRAVPVSWRWHLCADDLKDGPARQRLRDLCGLALRRLPWTFVLGRPDALGHGVSQAAPAVLQAAVCDLEALLIHVRDTIAHPRDFIAKSASLCRLALAAGHAKRAFVRKNAGPALRGAFLTDRAALAVTILGIRPALHHLFPGQPAGGTGVLQFARDLVAAMRTAFATDPGGLPVVIRLNAAGDTTLDLDHPESIRPRLTSAAADLSLDPVEICLTVNPRHPLAAERILSTLDVVAADGPWTELRLTADG